MFKRSLLLVSLVTFGSLTGVDALADGLSACLSESGRFVTQEAGCMDKNNGLVWGFRAPKLLTRDEAVSFCGSLAKVPGPDKTLMSWRLPTILELRALANVEGLGATLDFPVHTYYWASNFESGLGAAVIPETGEKSILEATEPVAAVCVARAFGCLKETERFRSEGGGCHDRSTGFVWDTPSPRNVTQKIARQVCENQVKAGFSDWILSPHAALAPVATGSEAFGVLPGVTQAMHMWASQDFTFCTFGDTCRQLGNPHDEVQFMCGRQIR